MDQRGRERTVLAVVVVGASALILPYSPVVCEEGEGRGNSFYERADGRTNVGCHVKGERMRKEGRKGMLRPPSTSYSPFTPLLPPPLWHQTSLPGITAPVRLAGQPALL